MIRAQRFDGPTIRSLARFGLPQEFAACVLSSDLDVIDGPESIEVSDELFVRQCLMDMWFDNLGKDAIGRIDAIVFRWGTVQAFQDESGRKLRDMDGQIAWINAKLKRKQPPRYAMTLGGGTLRMLEPVYPNAPSIDRRAHRFVKASEGHIRERWQEWQISHSHPDDYSANPGDFVSPTNPDVSTEPMKWIQ